MATNRATRYPGRWGAVSADYPMGVPKNRTSDTAKDGSYFEKDWVADYEAYFGALLDEAGQTVNGTTDTAQNSQLHKAMQIGREVSPRNNDWNGYLDPEHTVPIEKSDTSAGTRSFVADAEIAPNLYVSAATNVTFSSTGISWLAGNSLYKLYDYTTEQLADIDETTVPVYLKDQNGVEYFLKHNGTSVIVTKVGSQLKVEITDAIFAELGIANLWRFFVTERVGRVIELSVDATIKPLGMLDPIIVNPSGWGNGTILSWDASKALSKYKQIFATGTASFNGLQAYARSTSGTFKPDEIIGDGAIVFEYTAGGSQVEVTLESITETGATVGVAGANFGNLTGIYGVL